MSLPVFAIILAYICAGRWIIRQPATGLQDVLFGTLNLGGVYLIFFHGRGIYFNVLFLVYLGWVAGQYLLLRVFSQKAGRLPWLAFLFPILALIFIRYGNPAAFANMGLPYPLAPYFVGISYLAFRSSQLVLLVRNGVVPAPGFWRYLSFCFFLPTLQVGPISPYTEFIRAFGGAPVDIPAARAGLRILVGAVKYQFLGPLCSQLAYSWLLLDDHYHPWMDLPVAMLFYYVYLYLNTRTTITTNMSIPIKPMTT